MDRKERIKLAYETLRSQGKVHKQQDVADKMGVLKSVISMAFNGNEKYLTDNFLLRFNTSFNNFFNLKWLLSGEGEMLGRSTAQKSMLIQADDEIPFYDGENFECGTPKGFCEALMHAKPSGYMRIYGVEKTDDTFIVKAHGDSMINRVQPEKSIIDGTWVALRKLSAKFIRWGEVYAIATADGYMIKKLQMSEREGYVTCVSFNTEDGYAPFEIEVNEIYDLAIVVGTANFRKWL